MAPFKQVWSAIREPRRVRFDWENVLGDEFGVCYKWLIGTHERLWRHPCPHELHCIRQVGSTDRDIEGDEHDEGDARWVGQPELKNRIYMLTEPVSRRRTPEGGSCARLCETPVFVPEDALLAVEFQVGEFVKAAARKLGINDTNARPLHRHLWKFGLWRPEDEKRLEYSVWWSFETDGIALEHCVTDLLRDVEGRFIVLHPFQGTVTPATRRALAVADRRGRLVALEHVLHWHENKLEVKTPLRDALRGDQRRPIPASEPPRLLPCAAYEVGENVTTLTIDFGAPPVVVEWRCPSDKRPLEARLVGLLFEAAAQIPSVKHALESLYGVRLERSSEAVLKLVKHLKDLKGLIAEINGKAKKKGLPYDLISPIRAGTSPKTLLAKLGQGLTIRIRPERKKDRVDRHYGNVLPMTSDIEDELSTEYMPSPRDILEQQEDNQDPSTELAR